LIESFERRNICDMEIDAVTLNAGGTLAGIVSRTVRPSPGRSSTTLTATADEGAEVARVGVAIAAGAPNGAMCGRQSC
jgi:hypothetical protein